MKLKQVTLLIICITVIFACDSNRDNKINKHRNNNQPTKKVESKPVTKLAFQTDEQKADFHVGEILKFKLTQSNDIAFDSIKLYINDAYFRTIKSLPIDLQSDKVINKLGDLEVEAQIFADSSKHLQSHNFTFLSDVKPQNYSYKVKKMFPHDERAFTQGLVFDNGYLYEATGLKGESSLRKVQLSTGDVLQALTIDKQIFGEGISILNNKIIQLSWTSRVGFIYDKNSFKQLNTFSYATEGWGLTNDGKNLIMSDGTNIIYYLDSETYTEVSRIEVYDNEAAISNLNELEYINGDIYANVYQTDKIAIIDAKTGKVKAYINLEGLLSPEYRKPETGVLNGIAYDFKNKRLFVTGKKWTKLFEIEITKP